jgi:hypothetical protein
MRRSVVELSACHRDRGADERDAACAARRGPAWGVFGAFGPSGQVATSTKNAALYGNWIPRNPHQGHAGTPRNDGVGGSSPPVGFGSSSCWYRGVARALAERVSERDARDGGHRPRRLSPYGAYTDIDRVGSLVRSSSPCAAHSRRAAETRGCAQHGSQANPAAAAQLRGPWRASTAAPGPGTRACSPGA